MKAILLISHGSRLDSSKDEVVTLVETLRRKSGVEILEYAFLELESPSIPEGVEHCVRRGATEIVVLLNFLNSGQHVLRDIPKIVEEARKKYPQIRFRITEPIGQHPKIADLFLDLID